MGDDYRVTELDVKRPLLLERIIGFVRVIELLRRHPDRILYGSDYPNLPYDWQREWNVIRALQLPSDAEAAIMGGTAARLFHIQG